ncbi:MAG: sigma-54 dependent transcriptional regulator [Thermodesulfobacteriota bacterium]
MISGQILIIDDERTICEACLLILSEMGHKVEYRLSGQSGLEEVLKGHYDLTLLDMKLPDMDGMEILKAIVRETPNVHVIVMTGYSTVENAVQAMKLGAFDYLTKPFTEEVLLEAVQKSLEKKRLIEHNLALRQELHSRYKFSNIIGEDPKMLRIFDQIQKVAATDSTVIIYGESGTGKEMIARAVHAQSLRAAQDFVPVDCGALAGGLLESELFGHVKGAFTGAIADKPGLFQVASAGTLFLDEVANLSLEIQAKLLRALETREFKPVGDYHFKKTNARVIAASNQDLKALVENSSFRADLYYRLNVLPIYVPPLRERKMDVPPLAYHFLRHFSRKTGRSVQGFSDEALEMLLQYDWPGNIRQLKNTVERLVIMWDVQTMDLLQLIEILHSGHSWEDDTVPRTAKELQALKKRILEKNFGPVQKAFLIRALKASQGSVTQAARSVGIKRSNFSVLMKKHGLTAEHFKEPAA